MDRVTTDDTPDLNFIRDEPAGEDLFGSHDRLARAMAAVIRSQKDLKVVGLLGAWGSGKSTVVKLVQSHLEIEQGGVTSYCFPYDAWLHQSDPPRRSFLETLIKFLIDKKLTAEPDKWQVRLDQLNRQVEDTEATSTPTLTTTGRVALFSLLLLPLGMELVGHDWVVDAFSKSPSPYAHGAVALGLLILLFPILFASLIYFRWRSAWWPFAWRWPPISKKFWNWKNFTSHKPPHEDDSILSLIMNKEVQRVRNRVTRSLDPTAIEFQNIFREIMEDVSTPDRRFLFVIDNLDRLPEVEAVAMWGTIRSFFLGAVETNHVRRSSSQLPTVILPIDPHAVERMYAVTHGEYASSLAQSFTDKTFDLTFRVTQPVLSDWKAYLTRQMRGVFGQHIEDDSIYLTGLLLESSLTLPSGTSVTPRGINTLINQIGTLWLQWHKEDIAFASIAYYAIYLRGSEVNIHVAIGSPQAGIASYDPNWQRAIAAIYYGVPPQHAVQILIEQRLRTAITERDMEEFKRLGDIPGFEQVLQRILDQATGGDISDPTFVLNAAELLDALRAKEQAWTSMAWWTLRRGFAKSTPWQTLSERDAPALTAFLSHCGSVEATAMLSSLAAKLASSSEQAMKSPVFVSDFTALCEAGAKTASRLGVKIPEVTVPGTAALYLKVLAASAQNDELLRAFKTNISTDDVIGELALNLADQTLAPQIESKLRALLTRNDPMPWSKLIEPAALVVQDQNANAFAMNPSLLCLGLLRKSENAAQDHIKRLFDGQQLATRFHEAHAQRRLPVEALSIALLMISGPTFPMPAGQPSGSFLNDRPELVGLIDTALLEFDTPDNLETLVQLATTNTEAIALIRGIISLRVREKRMGRLLVDHVIAGLPQYLNCVDAELQDQFVQVLATYDTFWATISPLALDPNVVHILRVLIGSESGEQQQAKDLLFEKLKGITTEQWGRALVSGTEPLPVATALSQSTGGTTHLSSAFYDALKAAIQQLLTDTGSEFRVRWFDALALVNASSRQTLLKYVRDQITRGTAVSNLIDLLTKGSETLLTDADFAHEPDGATRYVILPLLGNEEGIAWLVATAPKLESWVVGSETATRNVLVDRLSELWTGADEQGKKRFQDLELAWNLPELPIATADEQTRSGSDSTNAGVE